MSANSLIPLVVVCGLFGSLVLMGIFISYLSLRYFYGEMSKCPECGRREAGEFIDSEVVESKTHIEHKKPALGFGDDLGKRVRITEKTHKEQYRCAHCGHEWIKMARERTTTPIE